MTNDLPARPRPSSSQEAAAEALAAIHGTVVRPAVVVVAAVEAVEVVPVHSRAASKDDPHPHPAQEHQLLRPSVNRSLTCQSTCKRRSACALAAGVKVGAPTPPLVHLDLQVLNGILEANT